MKHTTKIIVLMFVGLFMTTVYTSCRKDDDIQTNPDDGVSMVEMTPYEFVYPAFYPAVDFPDDNVMYEERVMLGKTLFFDTRLSNNGESCNTCHLPEYGFAAPDPSPFDRGLTKLPLINLAWYKNFMWEGRLKGPLEDVMMSELSDRFNTDVNKINDIDEYRQQFRDYYGVSTITKEVMAKALAQYMRALVSKDTKYDRYIKGQVQLTFDEEKGRQIFMTEKGDCFHCHANVIFTIDELKNNGLDTLYNKEIDNGYYNVTGNPDDLGKFRVPNLRNVALRTDFMHDGRFKTLEEVVAFYDTGVHFVPNVDPLMTKENRKDGSLGLTALERQQLVAFLHTLTDSTMINDPLFQAP